MSFLTQKKANEVFASYKQAELSGDDDLADSLEAKLNQAGWRITNGQDGLTIVKDKKSGLSLWNSSVSDTSLLIPRNTMTSPYYGDSNARRKTGMFILIGLGAIVLIIGIVLAVKAYKKAQNGRA